MIFVHRALLLLIAGFWALSFFYAIRALTGRPHRARRATRTALAGFVLMLVDTLGRTPIVLRAAEETGDPKAAFWAVVDLSLHHAAPLLLFGAALFGRWRGWLADKVMALAVLIAVVVTAVLYLVPP